MESEKVNKKLILTLVLSVLVGGVHAQHGGYRYNRYGQLVDGRGQLANPHQQYHDMTNPALWTVGATAVSNTVDPAFQQSNLGTIEGAIAPNPEPGGQAMSRLYLTPTNPYTPNTGVQSGSPQGYNYDHYQQIMVDAPVGGYVPTESGAYIAKTHPGTSSQLTNWGFHTYEASPNFVAAQAAAGGRGGGVVVTANQSAESYNHLRAISGSNEHMNAYVRPSGGGVVALRGQVVLNPEHNTNAALETNRYGPAFVAGISDYQGQTVVTGNEAGFWVSGTGNNTQISGWGNGSSDEIRAAYNPDAQFHVHTHPGNTGPSLQDMQASAILNGMPGMVVSSNGNYTYGFQVEAGILPTTDGVLIFNDRWGASGYPGTEATRSPRGPTNGTFSAGVTGEATLGQGVQGTLSGAIGFDNQGNLNVGGYASGQITGGYLGGAGIIGSVSNSQLNPGISTNPVSSLNVGTANVTTSASVNLSDPSNVSAARGGVGSWIGASVGVGIEGTAATALVSGRDIDAAIDAFSRLTGMNNLSSSAYDYRGPDLSRTSPAYGGTYGGPNRAGSYTDNGSNYGGRDGNTAPNGSAINGFM